MTALNLRGVDLNLLVVLEALLRTSSVTTAARELGLSQSAASHALKRLRKVLGDPLLVRSRIFVAGSYETFRAGRALPLGDVKLGYVLVAVTIGLWGSIAYVGLELWRDGRRAASR